MNILGYKIVSVKGLEEMKRLLSQQDELVARAKDIEYGHMRDRVSHISQCYQNRVDAMEQDNKRIVKKLKAKVEIQRLQITTLLKDIDKLHSIKVLK